MKICLARPNCRPDSLSLWRESPALLESYWYWKEWDVQLVKGRFFLIDSGAFSFMQGKTVTSIGDYLDNYIELVNKTRPTGYFELDLDAVMPYESVKEMTRRMEQECYQPPIPVWHESRGKTEFEKMCKKYEYVAVGGIAKGNKRIEPYLPWFVDTAHKHGCKIHGLGYVRFDKLKQVHFDSVDSTGWESHQYGNTTRFEGDRVVNRPYGKGFRGDYRGLCDQALAEWIKYQKWAENNL